MSDLVGESLQTASGAKTLATIPANPIFPDFKHAIVQDYNQALTPYTLPMTIDDSKLSGIDLFIQPFLMLILLKWGMLNFI